METIKVDSSIVDTLLEWYQSGRGVRMWENADLSSGNAGERVFTPGDITTKPHWKYVDKGTIDRSTLIVESFQSRTGFTGNVKRKYWGFDVADTSKAKANRMLLSGETWVYTVKHDGRTYAQISIGKMIEKPFPQED